MAAFLPPARVRYIEIEDVDVIHALLERNSIFSLKRNDIAYIQQNMPSKMLVADLFSGHIVGACFVFYANNKYWITGIAAVDEPALVEVPHILFEVACSTSDYFQRETIAPAIMREYLNRKLYKWRWDIHLYCGDSGSIIPPTANSQRFRVRAKKGIHSFPFLLHFGLANGNEKIFFVDKSKICPDVCFRLCARKDIKVVGYGALHRNSDFEWVIGCLYAANADGVRTLLNKMILYIQHRQLNVSIKIYVIGGSVERTRLLEDSGFRKLQEEWSRYSSPRSDDNISDNFQYSDAERVTFAVQSVINCHF